MQSFCVASQTIALHTWRTSKRLLNHSQSITTCMQRIHRYKIIMRLAAIQTHRPNFEWCIENIKDWCSLRHLQLNADKTEVIWFSSRFNLKKLLKMDTTLQIFSIIIQPIKSVRNISAYMDSELSMRVHIGKVSSACLFHLLCLRQLRYIINTSMMQRLVSFCAISHWPL